MSGYADENVLRKQFGEPLRFLQEEKEMSEITAKAPWLSSFGDVPATLDYPEGSMVDVLGSIAEKHPNNIAFDFMGRSTSYYELMKNIERCAQSLKAIGLREGDRLTIAVSGRVDTVTAPALEADLKFGDAKSVVIDLADVPYMSSAGLRLLLTAHKTMLARGGELLVANVQPSVMEVLDITGFSGIFRVI